MRADVLLHMVAGLEAAPGDLVSAIAPPDALRYALFDPTPCGFPPPRVALLPSLQAEGLGRGGSAAFRVVGDLRPRRLYRRGRYALYDAYRLSGAGPGSAVLVPAYHCRTMLDPAIHLGAEVLLYPLSAQLVPDLNALERLVAQSARPVRALLLTHYFGFAQDTAPQLQAFCRRHGIALVEDCSHALFNGNGRQRVGTLGDYTIASPYKLFPCEEGGWLLAGPAGTLPEGLARRARWVDELRVLRSAWQRRRDARASALPRGDALAAELTRQQATPVPAAGSRLALLAGPSPLYQVHEQAEPGAAASGWLLGLCDVGALARRRRAHYARWLAAMAGVPHAQPLFAALPDDTVPYMFPLLLDAPEAHFAPLKRLGVPIWRWDEMAVSSCPVATRYSRHLLHLPCHQSLGEAELGWMIDAVTQVLTRVPASPSPDATAARPAA